MRLLLFGATLLLAAAGCSGDPVYLMPANPAVEVQAGETANGSLVVPFLRDPDDRQDVSERLDVPFDLVPRIRREDVLLAIEWTIKNLDDRPATASVSMLAANEFGRYDPEEFVIDPDEDEAPPPLLGGAPVDLPPLGSVSGLFREEEMTEAAQDLDAIVRAGIVPQVALLTVWPDGAVTGGDPDIPAGAVAAILQVDLELASDAHVVLEFVGRVRDSSTRLAPTAPEWEIVPPSDVAATPPMVTP